MVRSIPYEGNHNQKTIECLRDSFARFGLPRVLVSDNGSQFTSYEFQRFMHKNGVRHKTSAPFKPSSNGQAERYVATLKQSLRAMHKYEGTIQQKLSTFLMQYRKAPNVTTTLSPAMLFLKRDIRTRIDLLLPELKTKFRINYEEIISNSEIGNLMLRSSGCEFTEQLILDGSLVPL
ncbi:uncharacterized protein K02A2.6 [Trichonephila clavipes]|nr:uncharacterized protein K02A2.6 [Trichonephila clavipes]